jgi:hypothetical protein
MLADSKSIKPEIMLETTFQSRRRSDRKRRLRVRGRKVKSTEEVSLWIYELIASSPKKPRQLQAETGFSAMQVWRYTGQLLKEGKIEKDGHFFKKKGLGELQVKLKKIDGLTKESFSKIRVIQPLIESMKRPDLRSTFAQTNYAQLRSICIGITVPSFKCHPKNWHHPETTIAFRDEYFKRKNTNRLPRHIRIAIRAFYQLCLNHPLTEMEAAQLGIGGGNDEVGKHADCKFYGNEFEDLINHFLRKNDLELAAYVAFATETFGRPERVWQALIHDFSPVKERKTRTKASWDSDWSYDERLIADRKIQVELNPLFKEKLTFEDVELEVFEGKLYESKTNVTWPKEIRNPLAVSTIKSWLQTRAGIDRIFGNDDESFNLFSRRINKTLKETYREIGLSHPYFSIRPSYALRHCGAHLWLLRTGYNYDVVASMGWEDINTLRLFYGKYDSTQRKKLYRIAY